MILRPCFFAQGVGDRHYSDKPPGFQEYRCQLYRHYDDGLLPREAEAFLKPLRQREHGQEHILSYLPGNDVANVPEYSRILL